MKGLRSIPRVLKINELEGDIISLLFNNGYSLKIDLRAVLTQGKPVQQGSLVHQILESEEVFNSVAILGNSIGWPQIGRHVEDFDGNTVFYPYDIDPVVLYEAGTIDPEYHIDIGREIRDLRKQIGLTQSQLASRVGTTKHYISKLENNKSDIELLTLKKIVEAGLGGRLRVEIELQDA